MTDSLHVVLAVVLPLVASIAGILALEVAGIVKPMLVASGKHGNDSATSIERDKDGDVIRITGDVKTCPWSGTPPIQPPDKKRK